MMRVASQEQLYTRAQKLTLYGLVNEHTDYQFGDQAIGNIYIRSYIINEKSFDVSLFAPDVLFDACKKGLKCLIMLISLCECHVLTPTPHGRYGMTARCCCGFLCVCV